MFGLRNTRGSCWVNAALQSIFRIPDVQSRLSSEEEIDTSNILERCLQEIWCTKGEEGLKDLYASVRTSYMPAGEGIGDSHELIQHFCDRIPFLDKLFRFKVGHRVECSHCKDVIMKQDSLNEFIVNPTQKGQSVISAIVEATHPVSISDWTCEKCGKKGCTKQFLMAEFPQILMFHMTSTQGSIQYTPIVVVNNIKYALISIVCFTGGHWMTYGRNMPPGSPWYSLDDMNVSSYDPKQYPLTDSMRLLMYYRLNE